ncbi:MAG: CBS domain-containing protein [Clostridia bacterium]|nr:CBS domain-containing protein [Clostridia bacterium]
MRAKEFMCKDVIYAKPEDNICTIAKLMNENHIGSIPICTQNKEVVGIITDRDIVLRSVACDKNPGQTMASDIMTTNVIKTTPDTDAEAIAGIMKDNQIRRIPVVQNEQIVGVVSLGNLAQYRSVSDECLSSTLDGVCHTKGTNVKNAE